MTCQERKDREALLCQLEEERKKLNDAIRRNVSSEECLTCSRRVDQILEQLIDMDEARDELE